GREHALVWAIRQSKRAPQVYCAPGNGGTAQEAVNIAIGADQITELAAFAQREGIDLTIVGPELPLTLGIVDHFEALGLRVIGPSAAAARLEGSKIFAKAFMQRHGIPTSACLQTDSLDEAVEAARSGRFGLPLVIKADGLAAGKGVVIARSSSEAEATIWQILEAGVLGEAGSKILLEQFLTGDEVSFLVFADGVHALPMAPSQDHKTVFDNDLGPNTGGMGAYSADWILPPEDYREVMERIVAPTLEGMATEGMPYRGILYFGLMLTPGGIYVLEYNARMGDPETQPVLLRLQTDLLDVCDALLEQRLNQVRLQWDSLPSVCVVLASGGYPGEFEKGWEISGLTGIESPRLKVFHAGTELRDGRLVTAGGRVLGVTAKAGTLQAAMDMAYEAAQKIQFRHMHFRRDIGRKGLLKERRAVSPVP
ncbi:MAG: phosphoribosylamine--glycine ligase, partial [Acidobacteria bacterium]|nr:phosphoribosylamine--glycine ligase [Acidobacteriota bacterium]